VVASQEYLGPYRLLNLVRAGKTCQVWEAIHDSENRRYALKVVPPEYRKNSEQLTLLKIEKAVGVTLDHPRVIKVYDFVADRIHAYLIMDYFPAPNMKQLILSGMEDMMHLMPKAIEQACEGLSHLHSRGWVHRDIKPDNFLLNKDGDVKLIDFALAVKKKGALGRLLSLKSKIQGTRSYMSPEQIRGLPLDHRADIYSFGCTVHELLGGKPPYTGTNTNDLLTKHLRAGAPPLEAANRNVTPEFAALVKRMLAKEPAARPESMEQVLREVKAIRMFKTTPVAPASAQKQETGK